MKIIVADDDGTVLGTIENLEEYDLSKGFARANLADEVMEILESAK